VSGARRSDHITPLAACEVIYPVQVGPARIQVAAWFNENVYSPTKAEIKDRKTDMYMDKKKRKKCLAT